MYQFLLSTHSHMRWLVMIGAVLAIMLPYFNAPDKAIDKKSKLPALFFMIICDVQLLIGLLLYFVYSGFGIKAFQNMGMGEVMKNADVRKIAVEHLILMLLAIILVHIGYSKIKAAADAASLKKKSLVFFGIALVLILAGIPWARL